MELRCPVKAGFDIAGHGNERMRGFLRDRIMVGVTQRINWELNESLKEVVWLMAGY